MSKWRPQGWKTPATVKVYPYLDGVQPMTCLDEEDAIIFEAGADAMLEALKKEGVKVTLTNGVLGLVEPQYAMAMLTKGKLVFMPDDKALDKTSN